MDQPYISGFFALGQHLGRVLDGLVIGDLLVGAVCLLHPRPGHPVLGLGVEELLCPDRTGIVDLEDLRAVVGDRDLEVVTECPAERA